jgi:hypothetical protein
LEGGARTVLGGRTKQVDVFDNIPDYYTEEEGKLDILALIPITVNLGVRPFLAAGNQFDCHLWVVPAKAILILRPPPISPLRSPWRSGAAPSAG